MASQASVRPGTGTCHFRANPLYWQTMVRDGVLTVRMDGVSKAYGVLWALREVRLEVAAGERVALLGPNGAGKTTLLKLLAALTYPTAGAIEVFGRKLPCGNSPLRGAIGFLASGNHLYDHLTVGENLRFFVSLYRKGVAPEEREEALRQVGLYERAHEYAAALSLGMRCRLAMAKWRLVNPRLLLADEPYGALDAAGADLLDRLFESLCAAGGVVVLATHDVPRALQQCSRAVILDRGQVVFDEPRQDPWNRFHAAFAALSHRGGAR